KDIDLFMQQVDRELKVLAEEAENPNKSPYTGEPEPYANPRFKNKTPRWLRRLRHSRLWLYYRKQLVLMHLFESHKLKKRLVRQGPDAPPTADEPAFPPRSLLIVQSKI